MTLYCISAQNFFCTLQFPPDQFYLSSICPPSRRQKRNQNKNTWNVKSISQPKFVNCVGTDDDANESTMAPTTSTKVDSTSPFLSYPTAPSLANLESDSTKTENDFPLHVYAICLAIKCVRTVIERWAKRLYSIFYASVCLFKNCRDLAEFDRNAVFESSSSSDFPKMVPARRVVQPRAAVPRKAPRRVVQLHAGRGHQDGSQGGNSPNSSKVLSNVSRPVSKSRVWSNFSSKQRFVAC
jgi:hypothetical protein